ncbi:MAG: hypothetical protein IKU15_02390 [Clostridia bacterium]|nr:hypothetical protein [Clostridia bacterium]
MAKYENIFKTYKTSEGIPFYLLNRRVIFPDDKTLYIYGRKFISTNIAWTVLSYQIYGTIEYWWVLCALNKSNMYYAKEGNTILYVLPEYISLILNNLN